MTTENCVRCNAVVKLTDSREIEGLVYCQDCAQNVKQRIVKKRNAVKQQKTDIVRERNVIEKEMKAITEDDTRHITITTTDTIVNRTIIDYVDIISVQDLTFHSVHFDPLQTDGKIKIAEKSFRNSIELNLSKPKKRAYLVGADAVVGVHIDSSIDQQVEAENRSVIIIKTNVTGTAVRLAAPA